jgi:uncharacterized protein YqeY
MLRTDITEAMKTAMRAHDEASLGTLRMILAKIKDADIAARPKGNTDGIGDAEVATLLQGMVKQRKESAALYEKGNRADLAAKENAEIAVIERFMPKQMNDDEVKAAIDAVLKTVGAASIKDMGKVMAELKKTYAGQMDFSAAGGLVKTKLGG